MNKEQHMTRGEFIRGATTALVTGAGLELIPEVEASKQPISNLPFVETAKAQKELKVVYQEPKPERELSPEIKVMVESFIDLSNFLADYEFTDQSGKIAPDKVTAFKSEFQDRKRTVWEQMRLFTPGLPDYSEEAFRAFIITKLPFILKEYDIFVKSSSYTFQDLQKDIFLFVEVLPEFFDIASVRREQVTRFGQSITRDVVELKEQTMVNNKKKRHDYRGGDIGGAASYGNAVLYPKLSQVPKFFRELKQDIESKKSASPDDLLRRALEQKYELSEKDIRAVVLRSLAEHVLTGEGRTDDLIRDESYNSTLEHETGHLLLDSQPPWSGKSLNPATKYSEHFKNMLDLFPHYEINGFLAELRYSRNKSHALLDIYSHTASDTLKASSVIHPIASRWICATMENLVSTDPAKYGIHSDENKKFSSWLSEEIRNRFGETIAPRLFDHMERQKQAILALAFLTPEKMELLAEDALRAHKKQPEKKFSKEYTLDRKRRFPISFLPIPPEIVVPVVVGGATTGGVVWLIKRRMRQERILRFQKLLEEKLPTSKQRRGRHGAKGEHRPQQAQQIFDGLQLMVPSKKVDGVKRRGAVNNILNQYQGNRERFNPVIQALMPLLDNETIQYVEGILSEPRD